MTDHRPERGHATGGFHLFAYGTLRSDAISPAGRELLRGCERVGAGTVRGTLYEAGRYPALLLSGEDEVRGEVWRCPTELLPVLDRYEGTTDGLFRRAAVRVGEWACWVYVAGPALGPRLTPDARVSNGTWRGRSNGLDE